MHARVAKNLARYVRTCTTIRVRENIRQSRSSKWYTRTTPYNACKLLTPQFLKQNCVYFIAKICLESKNQNSLMSNKCFSAYYYNRPIACSYLIYPIAKICLQSKNQNSVMSNKFLSAYYYNLPTACSYLMYPIAKICLQSKNLNSAMSNKFVSAYYYYLPIACSYLKKIGTPHGCMSHVSTAALFKWGTWKQWYIWYVMRQL